MANHDVFTTLPFDVVIHILKKLPTNTLVKLRCVCKHFKAVIFHPYFLKLHLSATATSAADRHHIILYQSVESVNYKNAYFSFCVENTLSLCKTLETPFESVNGYLRMVGSSKGVICLFDTSFFTLVGSLILWNPLIGKFKVLPSPKKELCCVGRSGIPFHMVVGFGFDRTTLDFKVIKIFYNLHESMSKALIYRGKTSSWDIIDVEVPCYMNIIWASSVFVNDVVHWLAYTWEKRSVLYRPNCIMGFDVVEETFKSMELPRNLDQKVKEIQISHLVERKSLALFVSYYDNVGELCDIWFMSDYGNVESWTKHIVLSLARAFFPVRMIKDYDVLVAASNGELMFVMDTKNECLSIIKARGLPLSFFADDYVPTLALLDSGDQLRGIRECV